MSELSAAEPASTRPLVLVMGVSGSGKSTIGAALAHALGVDFVDGDALHPAANVAKMAAGEPLDDADRWPWLARVGQRLAEARGTGLVVACSALRRAYRDAILAEAPGVVFLHLSGSRELLSSRLTQRQGHFMPPSLLESQLATLEPLADDEPGVVVQNDAPVDAVVAEAVAGIRSLV